MKKIVYAQIYEYLIKYKLIHPNQSGFRSKHSCVTALIKIVDHILNEMDRGNYTGVLLLDFKKAFDMVNHTILLSKLKVYKLDDLSLNWFRSYLSERSQKVIINNYESSAQNILYINDLPLYVDHSMSDLYADDTTIHFSSNSISDINTKLNEDMEKVQGRCTSNDMVINTMKSKSMTTGSSRKIQYRESNFNILYDDVLLNDIKYEKLLGKDLKK